MHKDLKWYVMPFTFVLIGVTVSYGQGQQSTSGDTGIQSPLAESQPESGPTTDGIQTCIEGCVTSRQIEAIGAEVIRTECEQRCAWVTYTNPRFGTTVDYPAYVFTVLDPPPGNSGGQGFQTKDGRAQLGIYAARNVENDTPQSYVTNYVDLAETSVTYKNITERFFVISGTREGKSFYTRCNFSVDPEGIIDCLSITYPMTEEGEWDAIVYRISESLRVGKGAERR